MTEDPLEQLKQIQAEWERRDKLWYRRPLVKWLATIEKNEKSFVEDHPRAYRLHKRTVLKMLLFLALMIVSSFFVVWPPALIWCASIWGATAAFAASSTLFRARAYRNGYQDGRNKMMQALHEDSRAGVPVDVFISQQMIRDMEGIVW